MLANPIVEIDEIKHDGTLPRIIHRRERGDRRERNGKDLGSMPMNGIAQPDLASFAVTRFFFFLCVLRFSAVNNSGEGAITDYRKGRENPSE